MDVRRTGDIPGLVSCGILALVLVAGGALAIWGYLSGPGGHPSNGVIAFIYIVLAATFVAPAGAVIGFAGLAIRYGRSLTYSAAPSLVGSAVNSVIFAAGASYYFMHF